MKKYIVMEVGSTNTKTYMVEDGNVTPLRLDTIEWKTHYKQAGHILEEDVQKLYDIIHAVKEVDTPVYVYGTSIFRSISPEERDEFTCDLESATGATFQVVSAEEESKLTTYGVVSDIDSDITVAVMIGGGGSTELSIVKNKEILESICYDFGVMDMGEKYPGIKEDKATVNLEDCLTDMLRTLKAPNRKVDALILAGGDHLKYFNVMGYDLDQNTLYESTLAPGMMTREKALAYDKDFFLNRTISEGKEKDPENKDWWNYGTRGMRICADVLASLLDATYMIPTSINMVYGIVAQLEER